MIDPRVYGSRRANAILMALTALLWALGVCPLPIRWARLARESARSAELNHIDREANSAGYYEGLIAGVHGNEGARSELALRLLGKPTTWARFDQARVAYVLRKDFLQFELISNVDRSLFGQRFTTNSFGMRDRQYSKRKPQGTFRIALLGSSMDMGWGVATNDTYENRLEDWLNLHAGRRGITRRFEVLNFAVAAYGPAQRLEIYHRKVNQFDPDLILYAETRLDPKLQQIHFHGLLRSRLDLKYDFLKRAYARSGIGGSDLRLDIERDLANKERIDAKLGAYMSDANDEAVAALARECRSAGAPLVTLLIPRVGKADSLEVRSAEFDRDRTTARSLDLPVLDLSATFDDIDPAKIEIAPWDNHPNALGHKLLFRALARKIVDDPALYRLFFGIPLDPSAFPPPGATESDIHELK